MHYLIQTDRGYELFGTLADALASKWMAYLKPVQIPEGEHYRGAIPKRGVLFTDSDQSSQYFAAMLANAQFAEQADGSLIEVPTNAT